MRVLALSVNSPTPYMFTEPFYSKLEAEVLQRHLRKALSYSWGCCWLLQSCFTSFLYSWCQAAFCSHSVHEAWCAWLAHRHFHRIISTVLSVMCARVIKSSQVLYWYHCIRCMDSYHPTRYLVGTHCRIVVSSTCCKQLSSHQVVCQTQAPNSEILAESGPKVWSILPSCFHPVSTFFMFLNDEILNKFQ